MRKARQEGVPEEAQTRTGMGEISGKKSRDNNGWMRWKITEGWRWSTVLCCCQAWTAKAAMDVVLARWLMTSLVRSPCVMVSGVAGELNKFFGCCLLLLSFFLTICLRLFNSMFKIIEIIYLFIGNKHSVQHYWC